MKSHKIYCNIFQQELEMTSTTMEKLAKISAKALKAKNDKLKIKNKHYHTRKKNQPTMTTFFQPKDKK